MSVRATPYIREWWDLFSTLLDTISLFLRHEQRAPELAKLLEEGKVPNEVEMEKHPESSLKAMTCMTTRHASLYDF
jgi:hypothetical protein